MENTQDDENSIQEKIMNKHEKNEYFDIDCLNKLC